MTLSTWSKGIFWQLECKIVKDNCGLPECLKLEYKNLSLACKKDGLIIDKVSVILFDNDIFVFILISSNFHPRFSWINFCKYVKSTIIEFVDYFANAFRPLRLRHSLCTPLFMSDSDFYIHNFTNHYCSFKAQSSINFKFINVEIHNLELSFFIRG